MVSSSRRTQDTQSLNKVADGGAAYDIIGDVHGCAHTLAKLLVKLGYRKTDQGFRHPVRKTLFVGDIVDRGPRVREALHIVYDMCQSGQAECVLGNHELYAMAYFTLLNDDGNFRYLRPHTPHHNRLIAETLEQFDAYPDEWEQMLAWFKTLPLFIEKPELRIVHACWDGALIEDFRERFSDGVPDDNFLYASEDPKSFESAVYRRLTRGTGMELPPGVVILGRDGIERTSFRTRFWSQSPKVYRDVVFQPDPLPEYLVDTPLTDAEKARLVHYGESERPVFIGHYWLQGRPAALRPNVACLDYSAVKYGNLVAYRFDGEQQLDNSKFVWVAVERDDAAA